MLDEFTLPKQVTNQSTSKQIQRRRQYLKSLCPSHCNTLLTGDPLFSFDPVVYEYVWSTARPPLPQEYLQYFEHLPDVPDLPQGQLVPYVPPHDSPPLANGVYPPLTNGVVYPPVTNGVVYYPPHDSPPLANGVYPPLTNGVVYPPVTNGVVYPPLTNGVVHHDPETSPPHRPSSAPIFPADAEPLFPSGPQHGAIPRRPQSAASLFPRSESMDVDPVIEYPPDNIPYPEAYLPPELQPYNPPQIPSLPYDPYPAIQAPPPPPQPQITFQQIPALQQPTQHLAIQAQPPQPQLTFQQIPTIQQPTPLPHITYHTSQPSHAPQQVLSHPTQRHINFQIPQLTFQTNHVPVSQPQLYQLQPVIPPAPFPITTRPPPAIQYVPAQQENPVQRPSRLAQIRQQLPRILLPSENPSLRRIPSGPPSIPPFQITTPPNPELAPQAEAAAYPIQNDPPTPPLTQSMIKKMKSALKRFPIRQYALPNPQSYSHQIKNPTPPISQYALPSPQGRLQQPKHSTPTSSTIPPSIYFPSSSSSTSSSSYAPLALPYYPAAPLPDLDHSMADPTNRSMSHPAIPLPDNDQSIPPTNKPFQE